jgi:glutathione peroxidase
MAGKTEVVGNKAHPFYLWASKNYGKGAIPKWNFHKIIIGKNGKVADTFSSITKPSSKRFVTSIEKEIKN